MSFIFSSYICVQFLISGIFNSNITSPTCAIESGRIGCVWDQSSNFSAHSRWIFIKPHAANQSHVHFIGGQTWMCVVNLLNHPPEPGCASRWPFLYFKLQTAGLHKENITLVKCSIGRKQSNVLPPWNNIPAHKTKWRVRAKNKCQSVLISQSRAICANLATQIWKWQIDPATTRSAKFLS